MVVRDEQDQVFERERVDGMLAQALDNIENYTDCTESQADEI